VGLLERVGRAIRFSPEGRAVRVWVRGMPGADETEVVSGRIVEVRDPRGGSRGGAVLELQEPEQRRLWVVPHEEGWGLEALWFSFISVDVFEEPGEKPLGVWFIRLGAPEG
jgi:hypothetical protein